MTNESLVVGTILFELAILSLFFFRSSPSYLITISIVNMICITLFSYQTVSYAGSWNTNLGNVWYASVILAQILILTKWGVDAAKLSRDVIFTHLLVFFALSQSTQFFSRSNELSTLLHADWMLSQQALAVAGCFAAFYVAQSFVVWMFMETEPYKWLRPMQYIVIATLAQVIDSLVFFPITFWNSVGIHSIEYALSGFMIKLLYIIVSAPVVFILIKYSKKAEQCSYCHMVKKD